MTRFHVFKQDDVCGLAHNYIKLYKIIWKLYGNCMEIV